jgi:hypothetical protein
MEEGCMRSPKLSRMNRIWNDEVTVIDRVEMKRLKLYIHLMTMEEGR